MGVVGENYTSSFAIPRTPDPVEASKFQPKIVSFTNNPI